MKLVVAPIAASCLAALATAMATAAPAEVSRVTFVGDSVPASILVTPVAKRELRRGFTLNLDLRVCRRLVIPSCTFEGSAPTSALQAVQGYGRALGDVLIVKVGYNESAEGYRQGIDRVMRAALSQGAKGVVWVTLRETRPIYHETNLAIKTAARRWPELVVADWNAYSGGHAWFRRDGLHLTGRGASELAAFLRRHVEQALA